MVDVSNIQAQRLIARGLAKVDEHSALNSSDLNDAMIDAIGIYFLKSFEKDGKPNVKAIDRFWDMILPQQTEIKHGMLIKD